MTPIEVARDCAKGAPFALSGVQEVKQLKIAPQIHLSFIFGYDGFAQKIYRERQTPGAQFFKHRQAVLRRTPGNELPGHPADVSCDPSGNNPGSHPGGGNVFDSPVNRRGKVQGRIGKILLYVTDYRIGILQVGEHIDEAKHLHFKGLVVHAPLEKLAYPVLLAEDGPRFFLHKIVEAKSRFANPAFDIGTHAQTPCGKPRISHISFMPLFSSLFFPPSFWVLLCAFFSQLPGTRRLKMVGLNDERAWSGRRGGLNLRLAGRRSESFRQVLANLWKEDKFRRDGFGKV